MLPSTTPGLFLHEGVLESLSRASGGHWVFRRAIGPSVLREVLGNCGVPNDAYQS